METLKLIICTIILLGFVATIMWACGAWNTRIFIICCNGNHSGHWMRAVGRLKGKPPA